MTDTLSPPERSRRMALVRGKDTGPEMVVRRMVHAMGYRYRLHGKGLPGKPDLVFGKARKAIFVHGCFWHRHNESTCKLTRWPRSRMDFWQPKLEANAERDARNERLLGDMGWRILVLWECQLTDKDRLAAKIRAFLDT